MAEARTLLLCVDYGRGKGKQAAVLGFWDLFLNRRFRG
jgi:hypothetical protein